MKNLSLCNLLTVVFIVLKLCHVIDWSWWWVVSPTLLQLALALALIVFGMVVEIRKQMRHE